LLTKKQ